MATRPNARKSARPQHNQTRSQSAPTRFGYRRKLRFEPLEARRVLANVTVTTLADTVDFNDGLTSLREAVFATNLVAGGDTINFAPSLTSGGPAAILLTDGELLISDDLAINGPSADLLTIDATGNDPTPSLNDGKGSRLFSISAFETIDVNLSGLTLTGADSTFRGGAILSKNANLAIEDAVISGNATLESGGGLYATLGTILIQSTTISNNSIGQASPRGGTGGGLDVRAADLTIQDSTISGNLARAGGGLNFVTNDGPVVRNLTIVNTTISGNQAFDEGGGVLARMVGGTARLENVTFEDNDAGLIQSNLGRGGALFADLTNASAEIVSSSIQDNTSVAGGGAWVRLAGGQLLIAGTEIASNRAFGFTGGGGLHLSGGPSGNATIRNSTIAGNNATMSSGGGVLTMGVTLRVESSTISGNSAQMGGGIHHSSAPLQVMHSTITGNIAGLSSSGGGIWLAGTPMTTVVSHSIIAGNWSPRSTFTDIVRQSTSIIVNADHSLIGTNEGSGLSETAPGLPDANGNMIGGKVSGVLDPLLAPLAHNGGLTRTHALLPNSPAVNAGNPSAMPGVAGVPLNDQRGEGFTRVHGGRIDIGAFELQPPLGDYNGDGAVNAADYVVWRKFGPAVSTLVQADAGFALVSNVTFGAVAKSLTSEAVNVTGKLPQSSSVVSTPSIDVVMASAARPQYSPRRIEEGRVARFAPRPRPDLLRDRQLPAERTASAQPAAFENITADNEGEPPEFDIELLDAAFTSLGQPL